jgi:hypothetical protein
MHEQRRDGSCGDGRDRLLATASSPAGFVEQRVSRPRRDPVSITKCAGSNGRGHARSLVGRAEGVVGPLRGSGVRQTRSRSPDPARCRPAGSAGPTGRPHPRRLRCPTGRRAAIVPG